MTEDETLDQEIRAFLDSRIPFSGDNYGELILYRNTYRKEGEKVIHKLLNSYDKPGRDPRNILKMFMVMDAIRSPDIAIHMFSFSSIGESVRKNWPKQKTLDSRKKIKDFPECPSENDHTRFRKNIKTDVMHEKPGVIGDKGTELKERVDEESAHPMDYSKTVLLHMLFIDDDLVYCLDGNTEAFLYGEDFSQTRVLSGKAFRDYAYPPDTMDPDKIIGKPQTIKSIRKDLVSILEKFYSDFDKTDPTPHMIDTLLTVLYMSLNFDSIFADLDEWCQIKGCSRTDICLIIVPDESLFVVPFGFLLDSGKVPAIKKTGGINICLGLVPLKYSLYRYHWRCEPHLHQSSPQCVFFATVKQPKRLCIEKEIEKITNGFGEMESFVFSDTMNADYEVSGTNFNTWHSSAEICWYSGHGGFNPTTAFQFETPDKSQQDPVMIPYPYQKLFLGKGSISNFDMLSNPLWNFSFNWLVVLNACLLGRSLIVGSNPFGFISLLYTRGAITTVSGLWPVDDAVSIDFSGEFSKELCKTYKNRATPKAAAMRNALVALWDKYSKENPYLKYGLTPYCMCGLP